MNRRSFMESMLAAAMAPAFVRAGSLMVPRNIVDSRPMLKFYDGKGNLFCFAVLEDKSLFSPATSGLLTFDDLGKLPKGDSIVSYEIINNNKSICEGVIDSKGKSIVMSNESINIPKWSINQ